MQPFVSVVYGWWYMVASMLINFLTNVQRSYRVCLSETVSPAGAGGGRAGRQASGVFVTPSFRAWCCFTPRFGVNCGCAMCESYIVRFLHGLGRWCSAPEFIYDFKLHYFHLLSICWTILLFNELQWPTANPQRLTYNYYVVFELWLCCSVAVSYEI